MSTTSGSPVAETWSVYRLRMGELAAGCGMYDKAHAEIRQRMTLLFGVWGGGGDGEGLVPSRQENQAHFINS
jgi:hypothetical protein